MVDNIVDDICYKIKTSKRLSELTMRSASVDYPFAIIIYHYTSPEGLLGIIKDKNLRFTRSDCLNDYSEGSYIINFYRDRINGMYENNEIDKCFYDKIINILPGEEQMFAVSEKQSIREKYQSYVCCFSLSRDSLPMWNYYSKNSHYEGYNIGFDFNAFTFVDLEYAKIIYSFEEQYKLIRTLVKKVYDLCAGNKDNYNVAVNTISLHLDRWQLMFKSPHFKHEEEVRLIKNIPCDSSMVNMPTILHRTNRGLIIPYINIKFDESSVKSVTIGPIADEIASVTTQQYLYAHNILADVLRSDIPIRY